MSDRLRFGARFAAAVLAACLAMSAAVGPVMQSVDAAAGPGSFDSTKVNRYVQTQMDRNHIPGLALGIVHGDQIVELKGFGTADDSGRSVSPQTPFIIGSTSKSFTALAVMQLVEAGKVDLDAPVQRYISWFRVADPNASAEITVRQLLNQTSGISTETGRSILTGDGSESLDQAVRDLQTVSLVNWPGAAFNYSDFNYVVLGLLVQYVAKEPYADYVQQHIFQPLDMSHSYTSQDAAISHGMATGYRYWFGAPVPFNATYLPDSLPAGYLISTSQDMSHYLEMYLNGGSYHGRVLLSPAGIAEMEHPAVQAGDSSYGMGWFIGPYGGVQAIWHGGDVPNFHTGMVLVPKGNWGIIVLENVNSGNPLIAAQIPALEQNVTRLVVGDQAATDSNISSIYLLFDVGVAIILVVQVWSLVRLLRRPSNVEIPLRSWRHGFGQLGEWVLPLLWEVGGPIAIWLLVPAGSGSSWAAILLYAPDITIALWVCSGLFLASASIRVIKSVLSLRSNHSIA